jgi:hypothetical protein
MPEIKSSLTTRFSSEGPMIRPAMISPTTCGAFSLRARSPQSLAATRIMARFFKISIKSIDAPLLPIHIYIGNIKNFPPYILALLL